MGIQTIVYGEVLFDVFENGQAIPGGAPFNVAWHLQGFGLQPIFISRVGKDAYGQQIMDSMQAWGMDLSGLDVDPQLPTGTVQVSLDHGQPHFDIVTNVAYDHVDPVFVDQYLASFSDIFLYHGSLIARTEHSSAIIRTMQQTARAVFVDINLRPPWWQRDTLVSLVTGCSILKLNDEELDTLTACGIGLEELERGAEQIQQELAVDSVVVTRGKQGAFVLFENTITHCQPEIVTALIDTVGAGDAFSSICILGMQHDWDRRTTLQRAAKFAARVCQQRGATSPATALYQSCMEEWQLR